MTWRLRRLNIPFRRQAHIAGQRFASYRIEGTDVVVATPGLSRLWLLITDSRNTRTFAWLMNTQLKDAHFPTRAAALRAFEAAATVNPPPAPRAQVRQVRRDGEVQLLAPDGARYRAQPDPNGGWRLLPSLNERHDQSYPTLASASWHVAHHPTTSNGS